MPFSSLRSQVDVAGVVLGLTPVDTSLLPAPVLLAKETLEDQDKSLRRELPLAEAEAVAREQ